MMVKPLHTQNSWKRIGEVRADDPGRAELNE